MNDHSEQMQQMRQLLVVSFICMVILFWWSPQQTSNKIESPKPVKSETPVHVPSESGPKIRKFNSHVEAVESLAKSAEVVKIENGAVKAIVNLGGLKIESLELKNYFDEQNKSRNVTLLSPVNAPDYYYIDFGWAGGKELTPGKNTIWKHENISNLLHKFTTNVGNKQYSVTLELSEKYVWKVRMNASGGGDFMPYIRIKRSMENAKSSTSYSHEGLLMVHNGVLEEIKYGDIKSQEQIIDGGGWIGFGDKYWFTGAIIDSADHAKFGVRKLNECKTCYQVDVLGQNEDGKLNAEIYVGAKEYDEIKKHKDIKLFDRVIDFGWFYFLTKPILIIIKWLYGISGNFGVAIILLTILVRAALFPLAHKSYKSMSKIRLVSPRIQELKEQYKNDKKAFNMAVIDLYRKEKINPAAGILPLFLQIPVFFALYKVLIVSIEMRDAPFFGWIKDLSEQDPTSIFNLFGLLPFGVPSFLQIGVLPIFMGMTLVLQQKLSPQPTDPAQAKIMKLLPIVFTFVFASFPSGLVLYWSVNNIISILQQWLATRESKN